MASTPVDVVRCKKGLDVTFASGKHQIVAYTRNEYLRLLKVCLRHHQDRLHAHLMAGKALYAQYEQTLR